MEDVDEDGGYTMGVRFTLSDDVGGVNVYDWSGEAGDVVSGFGWEVTLLWAI